MTSGWTCTQGGSVGGPHPAEAYRERLSLSPRHERDEPGHVLVSHQAGEHLGQLGLEVSVQLGFYVEPVHVGEDRHNSGQGVEVLN